MDIKKLVVGEWGVNCYLIIDKGYLAVVDPGDEVEKIIQEIEKLRKINPKYILLTHAHFDHLLAAKKLKEKYGFEIVLGYREKENYERIENQESFAGFKPEYQGRPDIMVKDGEVLSLGEKKIRVLETPGHTVGSISYLIGKNLFSGDTIFKEFYGRTDLPTGNIDDLWKSLKSLTNLDDATKIYPGHGEETTVGQERGYYS